MKKLMWYLTLVMWLAGLGSADVYLPARARGWQVQPAMAAGEIAGFSPSSSAQDRSVASAPGSASGSPAILPLTQTQLSFQDEFNGEVLDLSRWHVFHGSPTTENGYLVLAGGAARAEVQSEPELQYATMTIKIVSSNWKPHTEFTDSSFGFEIWTGVNSSCHYGVILIANGHLGLLRAQPDSNNSCSGDPLHQAYLPIPRWDEIQAADAITLTLRWSAGSVALCADNGDAQGCASYAGEALPTLPLKIRLNADFDETYQVDYVVAEPPQLVFSPTAAEIGVGGSTMVAIDLNAASNLYGYQFEVDYDETKTSATGAFVNTFFDTAGGAIPPGWNAGCAEGRCRFAVSRMNPASAITGSGTLAQITFTGLTPGTVPLTFSSDVLSDPGGSPISHATETATLTIYGYAMLSGVVSLQGRPSPGDTLGTVTLTDTSGVFSPIVAPVATNGAWTVGNVPVVPEGSTYRLGAAHALYLGSQTTDIALMPGSTSTQPATRLKGGDSNNDGVISIGDLSCIGGDFGGPPGTCGDTGSSDINADGTVNILDLVLAGGNYGLSTPQGW